MRQMSECKNEVVKLYYLEIFAVTEQREYSNKQFIMSVDAITVKLTEVLN